MELLIFKVDELVRLPCRQLSFHHPEPVGFDYPLLLRMCQKTDHDSIRIIVDLFKFVVQPFPSDDILETSQSLESVEKQQNHGNNDTNHELRLPSSTVAPVIKKIGHYHKK